MSPREEFPLLEGEEWLPNGQLQAPAGIGEGSLRALVTSNPDHAIQVLPGMVGPRGGWYGLSIGGSAVNLRAQRRWLDAALALAEDLEERRRKWLA